MATGKDEIGMTSPNARRTAKRERETWDFRFNLCAEVGRCEWCGKRKPTHELACHEILCGGFRQKCLDKRFALLVLDNVCHAKAQHEPKTLQLARLYLSRPGDLDLPALCAIWDRAPNAIEHWEVMKEVDAILNPTGGY
jgi:hypothetical protein